MINKSAPLKRSKALAPLSRDHHDALLLVWKIRQGIKKNIELGRITTYCQWFWNHYLQNHFEREEKIIVPFLGIGSSLSERIFEEHNAIRNLIKSLVLKRNVALLEELANLLNDHIRFEERILFNEVEKLATTEELLQIGEALEQEKISQQWEDDFWTIKK
jgi:hemerythrin-like domain-containing protein